MNAQMKRAKADWIKAMTEDFYADVKSNPTTVGAVDIGNTIIVIYATNVDAPLIGVAKCNPYDKYDRELGIAIAYARAIGEELPCYITCDGCNEDNEKEKGDYLLFEKLGIGAKYLYDNNLYIKVSKTTAYRYKDWTTVEFDYADQIDKLIKD